MKIKRTYIILALVLLSLIGIAYLTPKEVDWTPTYARTDKIPYGDYILYHRLGDIFPGSHIFRSENSFYSFGKYSGDGRSNYLIICDQLKADDLDVSYMASYAAQGNNIFIASYDLPQKLKDTLGIELKNSVEMLHQDSNYVINFTDEKLKVKSGYRFKHENFSFAIVDADSLKTNPLTNDTIARPLAKRQHIVLGRDMKGNANFIKVPFGNGAFYIHSFPPAFTNYNILKKNNSDYVSACLSFLPNEQIYWDEYYKPFRRAKADTPFRFILSVPSYTWALYTALLTMLVYMLFASKRVQRIIPIVKPPVNLSLQFTRTIGSLYYQQHDHRDIAVKKMTYMLEKVRQQYFLQTVQTDEAFRIKLAHRSNISMDTINGVFDIYERDIRRVYTIDEKTLIAFNTALEKFYQESGLNNK